MNINNLFLNVIKKFSFDTQTDFKKPLDFKTKEYKYKWLWYASLSLKKIKNKKKMLIYNKWKSGW